MTIEVMKKRKPRSREVKKKHDLMKPLDITVFGSQDDPCFGKLHSVKAKECQRCGDAEICSIVCQQRLALKRSKEGKDFKDIEEPNMDIPSIDRFIEKVLKRKKEAVRFSMLLKLGYNYFKQFEDVTKDKVKTVFTDWVKRSTKYNKLMKDGKKYIELK
jgi:hypothetical protein